MSQYNLLKIKEIIEETEDACSIVFDVPAHLESNYQFVQGQYLNLKTKVEGDEIIRAYSISSAPHEQDLKVTVKRIEGGRFSEFATSILNAGDELEVMSPQGNFNIPLDDTHQKSYVAFAAGSGITPIISIIKATLNIEPKSNFTLFFGNKTKGSIIFRKELEQLQKHFENRFKLFNILSQEDTGHKLFNGRLTKNKFQLFAEDLFKIAEVDHYFLCGPQSMVNEISDCLIEESVAKDKLSFELFHVESNADENDTNKKEGDYVDAHITMVIDDDEFEFDVSAGGFILTKAIEEDLDVPFSCQSGVCCTCRGKVMSGKVKMLNNYALEEDEVADGFVLTCQSIPITEEVTISMDE